MCEHGEDKAWMPELGSYGRYIDSCMVDIINELRRCGTETIACCCGHGKYPMTVIYRARGGAAIEYFTHKILIGKDGQHKKRNFYKLDDEGIYHLSELEGDA